MMVDAFTAIRQAPTVQGIDVFGAILLGRALPVPDQATSQMLAGC
jgi:hypothetical protein